MHRREYSMKIIGFGEVLEPNNISVEYEHERCIKGTVSAYSRQEVAKK